MSEREQKNQAKANYECRAESEETKQKPGPLFLIIGPSLRGATLVINRLEQILNIRVFFVFLQGRVD